MKKSVISSLNRKASFHRFVFISADLACVLLAASAPALAAEDAFAVSVLPSGITSLAPRLAEVAGTFASYNIKLTLKRNPRFHAVEYHIWNRIHEGSHGTGANILRRYHDPALRAYRVSGATAQAHSCRLASGAKRSRPIGG